MPREETGSNRSPNSPDTKSIHSEAEETVNKIGNASFQVQSEFFNTLQEMSRDCMARATSEVELGLKLSKKLRSTVSLQRHPPRQR